MCGWFRVVLNATQCIFAFFFAVNFFNRRLHILIYIMTSNLQASLKSPVKKIICKFKVICKRKVDCKKFTCYYVGNAIRYHNTNNLVEGRMKSELCFTPKKNLFQWIILELRIDQNNILLCFQLQYGMPSKKVCFRELYLNCSFSCWVSVT